jgi:hypothetical protein
MKIRQLMQAAALITLASVCANAATPKIQVNYDRSTNFASYKTFGFIAPLGPETEGYPAEITQYIKSATQHEMESRGYAYTTDHPDLLVNFNVKLTKAGKVDTVTQQNVGYYGYRKGQKVPVYKTWSSYPQSQATQEYVEGTLNVELIDAKKSQLVWEGVAIGEVKDTDKAVSDTKPGIDHAVGDIFDKYKFRAGS